MMRIFERKQLNYFLKINNQYKYSFYQRNSSFFSTSTNKKTIPLKNTNTTNPTDTINNELTTSLLARQIALQFHPLTVINFQRSINTIMKSKKHFSLIISSILFQASDELHRLIHWLNQIIVLGHLLPLESKQDATKEAMKKKLHGIYTKYWKLKCQNDGSKNILLKSKLNDPNTIINIHNLVEFTSKETSNQIYLELQKIINPDIETSKKSSKSKKKIEVKEGETEVNPIVVESFFSQIAETHRSDLPHIFPFLYQLDIPTSILPKFEAILDGIEQQNMKTISTLDTLLTK